MTFTPSIFYQRPKAALAWLERAFGFETTMLIEGPDGDERMMHSEMSFEGRGRIMVGAEWTEWAKSPKSLSGLNSFPESGPRSPNVPESGPRSPNTQNLRVDIVEGDVDAHCRRAREAGAIIVEEPETQFYGDRTYRCADLEGHLWTFAQKVKDMTVAEMEEAGGVQIKGSLPG